MFFWNYLAIPKTWITSMFGSTFNNYFNVFHVNLFAKKTRFDPHNIIKVYLFLNSFFQEFYTQKLGYKLKFGSWIEFAQLDKSLKTKPDLCKYEKLKLWHFSIIYLTLHDRNHELGFCDRFPNFKKLRIKFNVVYNNSWDILSQNFVKDIFVTITLCENKVPSSLQDF